MELDFNFDLGATETTVDEPNFSDISIEAAEKLK